MPQSAGDPFSEDCELIEVHVSELKQLFNAIDPSPFRERDLDPDAEEFITGWANEASPSALRQLLRRGRTSLVIGIGALGVSLAAGNLIGDVLSNHIADILEEGLLIGGWVAMWRPMEIFLYDWWPIRAEAALADRLSVMPVRISYGQDGSTDAWRRDWPAVSPAARTVPVVTSWQAARS